MFRYAQPTSFPSIARVAAQVRSYPTDAFGLGKELSNIQHRLSMIEGRCAVLEQNVESIYNNFVPVFVSSEIDDVMKETKRGLEDLIKKQKQRETDENQMKTNQFWSLITKR